MPVITLTDISLRNLKPAPGKQVTYFDRSLKGFGVCNANCDGRLATIRLAGL